MRLAVFDCDGTLIDGQASICRAMDEAFAELALPSPDKHLIRRMVGLSLPQAMRKLVPDVDDNLQRELVDATVDFNVAQFQLQRALGWPVK